MTLNTEIEIGSLRLELEVADGWLRSLGCARLSSVALRNPATRWLPWFDSFEGDVFRRFRYMGLERRGAVTVLRTKAVSDSDVLFRERRDASGDLCFRSHSWDAAPVEADFSICFEASDAVIDGHLFSGFRYWFEYEGEVPIHRLVDRQTWEVGGNLDDLTVICRNWLTEPAFKLNRSAEYSTVGLDKEAPVLPGSLWSRWSLLPSFDLQYGRQGVLLAHFGEVSLIRGMLESSAGEDCLRVVDMHCFEQSRCVRTNAKSILWCADVLDEIDALNLWTQVHEREAARARVQFDMPEEAPPAIVFSDNRWNDLDFDTSYERAVEIAAEFGADAVFIDSVWESHQSWNQELERAVPSALRAAGALSKVKPGNMCGTLDYEVAAALGGEAGLKALCDRARIGGVQVISWMAAHLSPHTTLDPARWGEGRGGLFATKESGRHPDTGYAESCWPINLEAPVGARMREQALTVCERTGLSGFLWDSFCNLGWWQINYSNGSLRPQFDHMMETYAELVRAGLYILPEALVGFSSHSLIGLHGGDIYQGDLLGYSYDSHIGSPDGLLWECLRGERALDDLFHLFAHKRVPLIDFHRVPREAWDEAAVAGIKALFSIYKMCRSHMRRRTVLKGGRGVLWENDAGERLLWSFCDQTLAEKAGDCLDLTTGVLQKNGSLRASHVYQLFA